MSKKKPFLTILKKSVRKLQITNNFLRNGPYMCCPPCAAGAAGASVTPLHLPVY